MTLNLLPIDELGNWCHQRLVGSQWKYKAQQGGSMGSLWVGTSPASGHNPAPSLMELQWRFLPYLIASVTQRGLGWALSKGRDGSDDPQRSAEQATAKLWQPEQCSVQGSDSQIHCTSKAGNCKYCKVTKLLIQACTCKLGNPLCHRACFEHLSRRPLDTLSQD